MNKSAHLKSCPEFMLRAECHCGCQSTYSKRRFEPNLEKSLEAGKPIGIYKMNWGAPEWLSVETQAIIDGYISVDYDPAAKLLRKEMMCEWDGRIVSSQEFDRLCEEERRKNVEELAEHVRESKRNLLALINSEGGMRFLQDAKVSPLGELMHVTLTA